MRKTNKGSSSAVILVILIVVVVFGAAGFGCYLYYKKKQPKPFSQTQLASASSDTVTYNICSYGVSNPTTSQPSFGGTCSTSGCKIPALLLKVCGYTSDANSRYSYLSFFKVYQKTWPGAATLYDDSTQVSSTNTYFIYQDPTPLMPDLYVDSGISFYGISYDTFKSNTDMQAAYDAGLLICYIFNTFVNSDPNFVGQGNYGVGSASYNYVSIYYSSAGVTSSYANNSGNTYFYSLKTSADCLSTLKGYIDTNNISITGNIAYGSATLSSGQMYHSTVGFFPSY